MKKRDVVLFIGIIVGSIIGTKAFAEPVEKAKEDGIGLEEVDRIIREIKGNPEFSMFYEAINQSKLSQQIAKLDKMTLMIPGNAAVELLPEDVWENFMDEENQDALVKLLNYHVIPQKLSYDELKKAETLNTLQEQSVKVSHREDLKVENAVIEETQSETKDVIVYEIDRLIMPLE